MFDLHIAERHQHDMQVWHMRTLCFCAALTQYPPGTGSPSASLTVKLLGPNANKQDALLAMYIFRFPAKSGIGNTGCSLS
jgi:hypothetical protein